jgi:bifunctional NMN adenylyltransferase/nudix hydrolase
MGEFDYIRKNTPQDTLEYLLRYTKTDEYFLLHDEYRHIIEEEKLVYQQPHGMNFITADSVVVQSGHILLVKRATLPGKGLWALPGVHVDQNETAAEASIRALLDETNLKVPEQVLCGSLVEMKLFDHPNRSLRGRLHQRRARTMTFAYYYELDSTKPLPKGVRGGKNIEKAWWFTFSEVSKMRPQLFEDHSDIIDYFIG